MVHHKSPISLNSLRLLWIRSLVVLSVKGSDQYVQQTTELSFHLCIRANANLLHLQNTQSAFRPYSWSAQPHLYNRCFEALRSLIQYRWEEKRAQDTIPLISTREYSMPSPDSHASVHWQIEQFPFLWFSSVIHVNHHVRRKRQRKTHPSSRPDKERLYVRLPCIVGNGHSSVPPEK